jgi:hypothetical protein
MRPFIPSPMPSSAPISAKNHFQFDGASPEVNRSGNGPTRVVRNVVRRAAFEAALLLWFKLGRTQKPRVLALHRPVALARAVLQCFRIEDLDFPAGVFD